MRQETNHEFFMDCYNAMYFKDTPHSEGGAILVDSEDGHVAIHGVEPEMIVRMFRNFVCAKHNHLFDLYSFCMCLKVKLFSYSLLAVS